MSVSLKKLYTDIYPQHNVRLLTNSCFHRYIAWVHIVENIDFISLLHGDELVFNSSLDSESDDYRLHFINNLISHGAGGLIVALQEETTLSDEVIQYCNEKEFPLFLASWDTSYLKIMRRFSEILLSNERNDTNLIGALKNALYYPGNKESYLKHFARNEFYDDMPYVISVLSNNGTKEMALLPSMLHHKYEQCIIYEEPNNFVLLTVGYSPEYLKREFAQICQRYPSLQVGIGSLESSLSDLSQSFEHATQTFQLIKSDILASPACYDELGIYQILCNIKDSEKICHNFIHQTLGALIDYDTKNNSSYMEVLRDFFQNECSITQTANATFFHPNTLKYKIKTIKEILGYDIMSNDNRTKIMLSLHLLTLADINTNE